MSTPADFILHVAFQTAPPSQLQLLLLAGAIPYYEYTLWRKDLAANPKDDES